mmetsp:Transcript_1122/g.1714  ORF Transcript_1122/g.1714 Transcript_1122/m.1714 type:complete len:118 (-) Transcript_1122:23-376(-)
MLTPIILRDWIWTFMRSQAYVPVDYNHVMEIVKLAYDRGRNKLIDLIAREILFASFTTDCWSDRIMKPFLTMTMHWCMWGGASVLQTGMSSSLCCLAEHHSRHVQNALPSHWRQAWD